MSKKKETPKSPIVISITLPDDDNVPRTGQILVQRGSLATFCQFAYSSLSEISAAIQQAATSLIQLEENPPAISPASTVAPQPNAITEAQEPVEADDDTGGADAADIPDDVERVTEFTDEAEAPLAEEPSARASQMELI
jgi:hypothetical protein